MRDDVARARSGGSGCGRYHAASCEWDLARGQARDGSCASSSSPRAALLLQADHVHLTAESDCPHHWTPWAPFDSELARPFAVGGVRGEGDTRVQVCQGSGPV